MFGDYRGTLRALKAMVRPGGMVVVGEPYWIRDPTREHLEAEGFSREPFGTHLGNTRVGEDEGVTLLYAMVSNQDDWDRYEGLQWRASADYAREHPDDPDIPELLSRVAASREIFLRWGREAFGWAIYLFRKPE